jgi:hypothetical protein
VLLPHGEYKPFGFRWLQGEALARCGGENQSIDGKRRVMPHQPPQRRLVEFAIPERRDQRQPKALQASLKIGSSKIGRSKIVSSKVSHWSISLRLSRRRDNKKPRPDGGVLVDRYWRSLSRASISSPRKGSFFRRHCDAHIGDHSAMMIGDAWSVNVGMTTQRVTLRCRKKKRVAAKKSRARKSPA